MSPQPNPDPTPTPDWDEVTDEILHLIQRSLSGDQEAFAGLQRRFYSPVLRFARVRLSSIEDAEDTAMETFLTLYNKLPKLANPQGFVGFLFGIARNCCNRCIARRQKPPTEVLLSQADDPSGGFAGVPPLIVPGADEALDRKESSRQLRRAIDELPATEREVLLLRCQEDLTYEQISQMLSISPDMARYRMRRGRTQLAALLPPEWMG